MKSDNLVQKKSYEFALALIEFLQKMPRNFVTFRLGDQLLRSGTSIGSNVEEAIGAYSRDDFIYKMNTALKETRETIFWLKLMRDARLVSGARSTPLIEESEQLRNILTSIVRTSRSGKQKT